MTKRMLGLEVVLAVGIVSVTAGITQLVPFLKERGVNINLGATMAQALDRADINNVNDEFRYVHVKIENNLQLASEHFGNESSSDMKIWGHHRNARLDIQTNNVEDGHHQLNMLLMAKSDIGCMGFDQRYECEPWPEINMEPLIPGKLDLAPLLVSKQQEHNDTKYYLTFYTKQAIPDRTAEAFSESEFDFSRTNIGYSDSGAPVTKDTAIAYNQYDDRLQLYRHTIDISFLFEPTEPRSADSLDPIDLNPATIQFQFDQSNGEESAVYELDIITLKTRLLTEQEIEQSQAGYTTQLKQQEPSMMDSFLNDGPFSIIKRLRDEQVNLDVPVEQSTMQYNGKTAKRVVYAFPVNTTMNNLERYVEIILDPATQTIFEYTLLDEQKGMVSRVTFLENKIITDMDPATFFTEEHWKNELNLVAGPYPFEEQQSTRTEIVQPE